MSSTKVLKRNFKVMHIEMAEKLIEHHNMLDDGKIQKLNKKVEYRRKTAKFIAKKRLYKAIVIVSIRNKSLKYNDRRVLKIRLWPRYDEFHNKLYDENGITKKVERYDVLAFTRLLVAAKSISEESFLDFLSIYDVKQIMDNLIEDYFGDVNTFLTKEEL